MKSKYNIEQIALDLITLSTDIEVCEKNNISTTTLHRLKNKEEFQNILKEYKEKMFDEMRKTAKAYTLQALSILMEIAKDKEVSASSRVSACGKIIEIGQTAFEQENILNKLEDIERRLGKNNDDEN